MVASHIFPPRFANNRQLLLRNSAASQWEQTKQSDPGQGKRSAALHTVAFQDVSA